MSDRLSELCKDILERAKLQEDDVCSALSQRKDRVADELAYYCQNDCLSKEDEASVKEIYRAYIDNVAPLIAQVEVEQHTLPRDVVQCIDELVQHMSVAMSTQDAEDRRKMFEDVRRMMGLLQDLLYMEHIDRQLATAKSYRREFRHFNATVHVEGKRLQDCIQAEMDKLKGYKKERKKFFQQFSRQGKILAAPLAKPENFALYAQTVDEVIELYEENYSEVVRNGATRKWFHRLMFVLTWLVPLGLALATVWLFLGRT